jgi:uncharacterized membrane protein YuzA (DUF378 family)
MMNLYQHLLILIPAFALVYWGFYAKESTGTIIAALVGAAAIIAYLVYVIIVPLFLWLGAL